VVSAFFAATGGLHVGATQTGIVLDWLVVSLLAGGMAGWLVTR